ncbi:unnamed protein product [Arctia plantaginis]|uniref:Nose resistant-to-fluoxetine protein N-terminal domain-containing protein n=1 Tax=Arctia plantaginis TaxID=874455 RepID=A0A8S0YWH7_ARCPL|nr:unnamed protein product [Arctia plantaginis]
MNYGLFLLVVCLNTFFVNAYVDIVVPDSQHALDLNLFEEVLDPELCDEQIRYIMNDTGLLFTFFDAGARIPRGILNGNTQDLGNYYQCLGINEEIPNSVVEGKYCLIKVPLEQNVDFPDLLGLPDILSQNLPTWELSHSSLRLDDNVMKSLNEYNALKRGVDKAGGLGDKSLGRFADNSSLSGLTLKLAICLPKVCSARHALDTFVNITDIGFNYEERFCRLPNDKPWVPGDYVAIAIFSLIGLLSILSTAYDLRYNVFLQKDPKKVNKLYQSFSVYNNTNRLLTITPVPGAIECLDGIRSFAMMWVIIGHTFIHQTMGGVLGNPLDVLKWITSLSAVWITSAPITVDTFFMLSGLLLVYTTHGKVTPIKLLKNLHLFYLNRIFRILPVLCAMILVQVSFLNWVVDGPFWEVNMAQVHNCRVFWWSTILHIQNFHNPSGMCLPHSWYLAIDMQLYILSPIILVWVLTGKRHFAWTALLVSLIAVLSGATVYSFVNDFPSTPVSPSRPEDSPYYMFYFYVNTLTRASPFFVGLIFGYLLSLCRGKTDVLNWVTAGLLWLFSAFIILGVIFITNPLMQVDWDNQLVDNLVNSFKRPIWAVGVGCLIFVCEHGYGGIVNWILSLRMFKILGRLSYAMYIVHYPLIFLVNAMPVSLIHFSVPSSLLLFLSDFSLAVIVAYFMTIFVDLPCGVLVKHFLGGSVKKPPPTIDYKHEVNKQIEKGNHREIPLKA